MSEEYQRVKVSVQRTLVVLTTMIMMMMEAFMSAVVTGCEIRTHLCTSIAYVNFVQWTRGTIDSLRESTIG